MAERYTRLASLPENQYTADSPILIAAGALLKDNQTGKALAQVKFKSISEKQIKAVKIAIAAFDVSGKELEGVSEYQYLDLTAARTAEFGHKQAVTLPDAVTRSVEVKCTDVFFADGTAWNAAPDAVWNSLPTQKSVTEQLGNLAAQYQRDTSSKSKFIPLEHKDLWFCSCGTINHSEESECHNCRHSKGALFVALDIDGLRQRDADYIAAEAEKAEKQAAADKVQRAKTTKFTIIAAAVIAVIVSVSLLTTKVIIPNSKYNNAVALMEAGKYEEAIAAFEALDGYKDSADRIVECETAILDGKYHDAVALMDAGKYEDAIAAFEALDGYRDSVDRIKECEEEYDIAILDGKYNDAVDLMESGNIVEAYEEFVALNDYLDSADKAATIFDKYKLEKLKQANVGDYVLFGAYEQDNDTFNGKEDIEWLVLEKKNSSLLIISKYVLDNKVFGTDIRNGIWETSTLRKWLNSDFMDAAFTNSERDMIPIVTVEAHKHPEYSINPGNATQDRVFLLSVAEIDKYFTSDDARMCQATDFAAANGSHSLTSKGFCAWWLRTPYYRQDIASFVDIYDSNVVYYIGCGVRPAMWITLEP